MDHCANSFFLPGPFARLTFLIAVIVLPAFGVYGQGQVGGDRYQKTSVVTARPCLVETTGEVTYLVKNGVELSVSEDWDCDRVADAYDNCVGMANETQTDSDGNGVGDVCEAATIVKAGVTAKSGSDSKARGSKAKTSAKGRTNSKAESRKSKASAKNSSKSKAKSRTAKAGDKRSRSSVKKRRNI